LPGKSRNVIEWREGEAVAIAFDIERESRRLDARKPYMELIEGIEVRKMSPIFTHGSLQGKLFTIVDAWSAGRGGVATEWRCWLNTGEEKPTSLVPDVAYVSAARWEGLDKDERERPPFAPDLAIEIRSPGDRERNVQRKIALYLQHGSRVVLDVRPKQRVIVSYDGSAPVTLACGDTFAQAAFAGLRIDVAALFAAIG